MEQQRTVGAVTYREAGAEYFAQRRLRRFAGVWSLWALGVAAVISGDFSGWNFGLDAGGFGGLLVATLIITVMYFGLCYSIAEMSPALPHTGGAYSFSRSAMGPWGGFATGVAETIEYVVTPAVIVTFAATYLESIFNSWFDWSPATWLWWLILYVVFVGLNVFGVEASFRFAVFICLLSLGILAVFYVASLWDFSWNNLTNIAPEGSNSDWFPFGAVEGVFLALPFAIWFYLAIEELPLAAEESHDPKRDIPRGTIYGLITLIITGFLVLFLNTGVTGAEEIRVSGEPLLDGFRVIFGESENISNVLGLAAVAGIIASFHTIIYAYGRNIYSLSRAGYYPHWLSLTHGKRNTPYIALVAGAVVGFGLALLLDQATKHEWLGGHLSAALLSMAVGGAVVSYFLQMVSFILLRRKMPHIERPYRSPIGIPGAAVGALIALVSLLALFWREDYRPGVVGVAIFYVLALAYFSFSGRNKLVLSPEEEFALTRGQHGHPETEGYGRTHIADIPAEPGTAPPAETT
ncbi:MAG TPA: ethanolamine permease [Gaiellaceae bacterium]|nr:ethanolamine permease [Gaiellaceae bacterium]